MGNQITVSWLWSQGKKPKGTIYNMSCRMHRDAGVEQISYLSIRDETCSDRRLQKNYPVMQDDVTCCEVKLKVWAAVRHASSSMSFFLSRDYITYIRNRNGLHMHENKGVWWGAGAGKQCMACCLLSLLVHAFLHHVWCLSSSCWRSSCWRSACNTGQVLLINIIVVPYYTSSN